MSAIEFKPASADTVSISLLSYAVTR